MNKNKHWVWSAQNYAVVHLANKQREKTEEQVAREYARLKEIEGERARARQDASQTKPGEKIGNVVENFPPPIQQPIQQPITSIHDTEQQTRTYLDQKSTIQEKVVPRQQPQPAYVSPKPKETGKARDIAAPAPSLHEE